MAADPHSESSGPWWLGAGFTATVYLAVGALLIGLGVWDIYADAVRQDEILWTTIVENAVTLLVGASVIGAGQRILRRAPRAGMAALARWTLLALAFGLVVTALILGTQALQAHWKPWIVFANFLGAVLLAGFATGLFATHLRQKERELADTNRDLRAYADEVERLSLTDELTQLPNRRGFDQFMTHHGEIADRYGDPLTVLMVDLDGFKALNDRYGHPFGDQVLRDVAAALADPVRSTDVVARWGGEEFAVLAPKTDREGALELAERLRQRVDFMAHTDGHRQVTASIGIAERAPGESGEALVARADAALYRAKQQGRNRLAAASAEEGPSQSAD